MSRPGGGEILYYQPYHLNLPTGRPTTPFKFVNIFIKASITLFICFFESQNINLQATFRYHLHVLFNTEIIYLGLCEIQK